MRHGRRTSVCCGCPEKGISARDQGRHSGRRRDWALQGQTEPADRRRMPMSVILTPDQQVTTHNCCPCSMEPASGGPATPRRRRHPKQTRPTRHISALEQGRPGPAPEPLHQPGMVPASCPAGTPRAATEAGHRPSKPRNTNARNVVQRCFNKAQAAPRSRHPLRKRAAHDRRHSSSPPASSGSDNSQALCQSGRH